MTLQTLQELHIPYKNLYKKYLFKIELLNELAKIWDKPRYQIDIRGAAILLFHYNRVKTDLELITSALKILSTKIHKIVKQ